MQKIIKKSKKFRNSKPIKTYEPIDLETEMKNDRLIFDDLDTIIFEEENGKIK